MSTATTNFYATGRRKKAIARVWIQEGKGDFNINSRPLKEYFLRESLCMIIRQPLEATNAAGRFDITADVKGGGLAGQAEALRHGIARALVAFDEALRSPLRRGGFMTRNPKMKERKKYGKKAARRSFQFTKR